MISTSYAATEEMTNTLRVIRLLMDPCTDQLRDLLRSFIPPANFSTVIQTMMSRLPRLTEPQRKLIMPDSGSYSGNYDDMDISLLYILLRNLCGIQEHIKGWGNSPDSADRSLSANIERLRLARNRCGHFTGGMSNADFIQVWSEIRAAVVDLDKTLGIANKYQEVVDFVQNDTMDPVRDKHYMDKLLNQMKELEIIMEKVDSLESGYRFECISRRLFCLWFTELKLSIFLALQERPIKIMQKLSCSYKRSTKEPSHWTSKVIKTYFIISLILKRLQDWQQPLSPTVHLLCIFLLQYLVDYSCSTLNIINEI